MPAPEGISTDIWRALREAPLFASAADTSIERLARTAILVEFTRGETIFHKGDVPGKIGVIVDAHARAVSHRGDRLVAVGPFWPGEVVGAITALTGIPFKSEIRAAESMRVAIVPAQALEDLLAAEPSVALSVINDLARRWMKAVDLAQRIPLDVTHRVAEYLSELPHTRLGDGAYSVTIPMARFELAASLGTTPETLSRAFRSLEDEGVIEAHDRLIVVPDGDALLNCRRESQPSGT